MSYLHSIRSKVGHEKIILIFASACILDGKGRMLWQRRADFGWWGLPGGVLELGESLPGCIVRESSEETGLAVKPVRLIGIYSSPDFDVTYPNGDQVHQVTFCFECSIAGGELHADNSETLDLGWFPAGQPLATSPWYKAMAEDMLLNREDVSFNKGRPGTPSWDEGLSKLLDDQSCEVPIIIPVVTAFIRDDGGRIFLMKSGLSQGWSFPVFFMGLGERIDQTAERGVCEQTGCKAGDMRVIAVYSEKDASHLYPCDEKFLDLRFMNVRANIQRGFEGEKRMSLWLPKNNADTQRGLSIQNIQCVNTLFGCRVRRDISKEYTDTKGAAFFPLSALPQLSDHDSLILQDALAGCRRAVF